MRTQVNDIDEMTLVTDTLGPDVTAGPLASSDLALAIAWSVDEPGRVAEVALVPSGSPGPTICIGRGGASADADVPGASFLQQRPGGSVQTGTLQDRRISRRQLLVQARGPDALHVRNVGRRPMVVDGEPASESVVSPGSLVEVKGHLLLYVTRRPRQLERTNFPPGLFPGFGQEDGCGIVGESPTVWTLRDHAVFAATHGQHVLVRGESGTGKELVARAIHALSARSERPLVSRNAATFPSTLVDAELYGNAKGFPNPGMPERPGLIGTADGSTLFLDEIGELPTEIQSHLLRVLDQGGEYQRLGESRVRRSDFQMVLATNRGPADLRLDLLARLRLQIEIPPLGHRREDIPLLARCIARRMIVSNEELCTRFADGAMQPRLGIELVAALLCSSLPDNVRGIERILWISARSSADHTLELTDEVRSEMSTRREGDSWSAEDTEPMETASDQGRSPDPTAVEAALERHGWIQSRAWQELGFTSRYQLRRFMAKHDIILPHSRAHPSELPSADLVRQALRDCGGVREKAWVALGLKNRYALRRLVKRYGLESEVSGDRDDR